MKTFCPAWCGSPFGSGYNVVAYAYKHQTRELNADDLDMLVEVSSKQGDIDGAVALAKAYERAVPIKGVIRRQCRLLQAFTSVWGKSLISVALFELFACILQGVVILEIGYAAAMVENSDDAPGLSDLGIGFHVLVLLMVNIFAHCFRHAARHRQVRLAAEVAISLKVWLLRLLASSEASAASVQGLVASMPNICRDWATRSHSIAAAHGLGIALPVGLLLFTLGVKAFVVVAAAVLPVLLEVLVCSVNQKSLQAVIAARSQRVEAALELLGAMATVKTFSWERHYFRRLSMLRGQEYRPLRYIARLDALRACLRHALPCVLAGGTCLWASPVVAKTIAGLSRPEVWRFVQAMLCCGLLGDQVRQLLRTIADAGDVFGRNGEEDAGHFEEVLNGLVLAAVDPLTQVDGPRNRVALNIECMRFYWPEASSGEKVKAPRTGVGEGKENQSSDTADEQDRPDSSMRQLFAARGPFAASEWQALDLMTDDASVAERARRAQHGEQRFELKLVSFQVKCGKLVSLVGAAGCGKTTLFAGIVGTCKKELWGDNECAGVSVSGRVGLVPQKPALLQRSSVRENVLCGHRFDPPRYEQALATSTLVEDLEGLPCGDATSMDDVHADGVKMRVQLARACYCEAEILLFDDPFTSMEPDRSHDVMTHCLTQLQESGKTVLFATSDLASLSRVETSIVVIRNGTIFEQGDFKSLSSMPTEFSRLLLISKRKAEDRARAHRRSEEGDPCPFLCYEMGDDPLDEIFPEDREWEMAGFELSYTGWARTEVAPAKKNSVGVLRSSNDLARSNSRDAGLATLWTPRCAGGVSVRNREYIVTPRTANAQPTPRASQPTRQVKAQARREKFGGHRERRHGFAFEAPAVEELQHFFGGGDAFDDEESVPMLGTAEDRIARELFVKRGTGRKPETPPEPRTTVSYASSHVPALASGGDIQQTALAPAPEGDVNGKEESIFDIPLQPDLRSEGAEQQDRRFPSSSIAPTAGCIGGRDERARDFRDTDAQQLDVGGLESGLPPLPQVLAVGAEGVRGEALQGSMLPPVYHAENAIFPLPAPGMPLPAPQHYQHYARDGDYSLRVNAAAAAAAASGFREDDVELPNAERPAFQQVGVHAAPPPASSRQKPGSSAHADVQRAKRLDALEQAVQAKSHRIAELERQIAAREAAERSSPPAKKVVALGPLRKTLPTARWLLSRGAGLTSVMLSLVFLTSILCHISLVYAAGFYMLKPETFIIDTMFDTDEDSGGPTSIPTFAPVVDKDEGIEWGTHIQTTSPTSAPTLFPTPTQDVVQTPSPTHAEFDWVASNPDHYCEDANLTVLEVPAGEGTGSVWYSLDSVGWYWEITLELAECQGKCAELYVSWGCRFISWGGPPSSRRWCYVHRTCDSVVPFPAYDIHSPAVVTPPLEERRVQASEGTVQEDSEEDRSTVDFGLALLWTLGGLLTMFFFLTAVLSVEVALRAGQEASARQLRAILALAVEFLDDRHTQWLRPRLMDDMGDVDSLLPVGLCYSLAALVPTCSMIIALTVASRKHPVLIVASGTTLIITALLHAGRLPLLDQIQRLHREAEKAVTLRAEQMVTCREILRTHEKLEAFCSVTEYRCADLARVLLAHDVAERWLQTRQHCLACVVLVLMLFAFIGTRGGITTNAAGVTDAPIAIVALFQLASLPDAADSAVKHGSCFYRGLAALARMRQLWHELVSEELESPVLSMRPISDREQREVEKAKAALQARNRNFLVLDDAVIERNSAEEQALAMLDLTRLEREQNHSVSGFPLERVADDWPYFGCVEVQDLTFRYSAGATRALADVSLVLPPCGSMLLLGPEGCGKTSFFHALLRVCPAEAGRIVVDGIDVRSVGLTTLRSRIAYVPQDTLLFKGSWRHNLDPVDEFDEGSMTLALRATRFGQWLAQNTTRGLDDVVDEKRLTPALRALLGLNRALLRLLQQRSSLLVLDRTTCRLDASSDANLTVLLLRFCRRREAALMQASRRVACAGLYESAVVLRCGRVVESGIPRRLWRADGSLLQSMCKEQGVSSLKCFDTVAERLAPMDDLTSSPQEDDAWSDTFALSMRKFGEKKGRK